MAKHNPLLTPPRETVVELFPGDVEVRLRDLYEQMDQAQADEAGQRRMGAETAADAIAREIDEVIEASASTVVKVRLREVSHRRLLEIQDDCPPREDNERDKALGVDEEAYYRAVIFEALVEPDVTHAQFLEFAESVSRLNWTKLRTAVDHFARDDNPLPKSSAVSVLAEIRETEARRRERTE